MTESLRHAKAVEEVRRLRDAREELAIRPASRACRCSSTREEKSERRRRQGRGSRRARSTHTCSAGKSAGAVAPRSPRRRASVAMPFISRLRHDAVTLHPEVDRPSAVRDARLDDVAWLAGTACASPGSSGRAPTSSSRARAPRAAASRVTARRARNPRASRSRADRPASKSWTRESSVKRLGRAVDEIRRRVVLPDLAVDRQRELELPAAARCRSASSSAQVRADRPERANAFPCRTASAGICTSRAE